MREPGDPWLANQSNQVYSEPVGSLTANITNTGAMELLTLPVRLLYDRLNRQLTARLVTN